MSADPRRLYLAAERIAEFHVVTTAEVSDSAEYEQPVVMVVIDPTADRVPPRVLGRLREHDLGIVDVSPQGSHLVVRAF